MMTRVSGTDQISDLSRCEFIFAEATGYPVKTIA